MGKFNRYVVTLLVGSVGLIFGNCLSAMAMKSVGAGGITFDTVYANFFCKNNVILTPSIWSEILVPDSVCRDELGNLYYENDSGDLERFCYQGSPLVVPVSGENKNRLENCEGWVAIPVIECS